MWLVRRRSPTQPTEIPRQSHRSGIIERSFALSWSPLTTYPDPIPLQRLVLRPRQTIRSVVVAGPTAPLGSRAYLLLVRTQSAACQGFREPRETLATFVTLASIQLALRRLARAWPLTSTMPVGIMAPLPLPPASGCSRIGQPTFAASSSDADAPKPAAPFHGERDSVLELFALKPCIPSGRLRGQYSLSSSFGKDPRCQGS